MHQLDAKNRMRIPAKLREELGEGYSITIGSGGCLYVYTKEQMDDVTEKMKKINSYREPQLKAARLVLYNTCTPEEDKQGRILLPDNLRRLAKIEKNIVVFKGPSFVEIWAEEVWNEYIKEFSYDDFAAALDEIKNV